MDGVVGRKSPAFESLQYFFSFNVFHSFKSITVKKLLGLNSLQCFLRRIPLSMSKIVLAIQVSVLKNTHHNLRQLQNVQDYILETLLGVKWRFFCVNFHGEFCPPDFKSSVRTNIGRSLFVEIAPIFFQQFSTQESFNEKSGHARCRKMLRFWKINFFPSNFQEASNFWVHCWLSFFEKS